MFLVFSKEVLIVCLKEGDEVRYHNKEITVKRRKHVDGRIEYYFDDAAPINYCIDIYDVGTRYALIFDVDNSVNAVFASKKLVKDMLSFMLLMLSKRYNIKIDVEKLVSFINECINAWHEMFYVRTKSANEILAAYDTLPI